MAIYCSRCGKELREGALFCRFCGASVNEPVPEENLFEHIESIEHSPDTNEESSFPQEAAPEGLPALAQKQDQIAKKPFPVKAVAAIAVITALVAAAALIFYFGGNNDSVSRTADNKRTEQTEETVKAAEETTESGEPIIEASQVSVQAVDINFSQVPDLDSAPVDVLIRVKNSGSSALKAVDYKISYEGKAFNGRDGNEGRFYAYGYIKAGETGYLYGQIAVPEETPRKQGDVSIITAYAAKDLGNYQMPSGKVVQFNPDPDTYDVSIRNPNDDDVHRGRSIVIAVIRDSEKLAGAWGCGAVNETIPAGEEVVLKDAIYDPGFTYKITDKEYTAFVIDKDILGIQ